MGFLKERKRSQVPEAEDSEEKEVFAFFGLCTYCGQVLEQGLVNLAVALHIKGLTQITSTDVDTAFDRMDRKTLGQLINDVRQKVPVSKELEEALKQALENRNYVVHRFFVEHSIDFLSEPGRHDMIIKLRQITVQLQKTDCALEPVTLQLWQRLGITEEMFETELARMKTEAAKRESAT